MQDSAKFWNGVAEKYSRSAIADIESYNYTLERTRSHLRANDKVLEIGCGTGSTALLLADGVEHITATDISSAMVNIATRKADEKQVTNISFVTDDSLGTSLAFEQFDAVLAFNILHLLQDPAATVQRLNGLLKPGGVFISKTICRPQQGFPLKYLAIRAVLPLMQMFGKAPFVNITGITELEYLITSHGFEIIETGNHPARPPSRYIVARKI